MMMTSFSMRKVHVVSAMVLLSLFVCTGCGKDGRSVADEVLGADDSGLVAQYFDDGMLLDEDNYDSKMQSVVLPYLTSRMTSGEITTSHGSVIYYETFRTDDAAGAVETDENSRGGVLPDTIVIFEGFSEFTRKYDEVTYYFLRSGYNVCRFDHVGLGLSSRDAAIWDDASLVYIDDYSTYVDDAAEVVERAARPIAAGGRLLLFAHSMGGCVGALFLEQHPDVFDKAVLTAPMLAVNTGVPECMAYWLSRVMMAIGRGAKIGVGQKTYEQNSGSAAVLAASDALAAGDSDERAMGFFANTAASLPRELYKVKMRDSDKHYHTNAATYNWVAKSVDATRMATKLGNVRLIRTNILMFQSQNDDRVRPSGQNRFRRNSTRAQGTDASGKVTMVYFPHVRHEIYLSRNEYLSPYYNRIMRFYGKSELQRGA